MKQLFTGLLLSCLLVTNGWCLTTEADFNGIKTLDLATAQRIALKGNPGLEAAQARMEQARAKLRQAAAAWWPSLDLGGSATHTRYSDTSFAPASAVSDIDQNYDSSSLSLQATWVLFDGFYRSFKQEQMQYGTKSSGAAHRDSQRLLVLTVAEAFFNAQLIQTRVNIAQADNQFYSKQLRDANNRFEVGTGSWGDVLNIKVQLNSAKTSEMFGKREYEAAEYGLAALMGIEEAVLPESVVLTALDRKAALSKDFAGDVQSLIQEALENRPDLEVLEMQKQAASAATGQAKSQFWPRVQLYGKVTGAQQGEWILDPDDFGNSVGVNLSWNLFAGGEDRAEIEEAEQAKREIGASQSNLRNTVAAKVRQNLALLAAAREQVRLQRESVTLVEENRELAQSEYEAGSASLVRLNEAQRDLTTTYGRLAQALVSYHQAHHQLLATIGRNLEPFADLPVQEPPTD